MFILGICIHKEISKFCMDKISLYVYKIVLPNSLLTEARFCCHLADI